MFIIILYAASMATMQKNLVSNSLIYDTNCSHAPPDIQAGEWDKADADRPLSGKLRKNNY